MLPWSAVASSKELWGAAPTVHLEGNLGPDSGWIGASLSHQLPFSTGSGLFQDGYSQASWYERLGNYWEERSPPHLLLSVLSPLREMLLKPHSRVQVFEGAEDNLPDRDSLRAALAIRQLAEGLTADDLLLVLISGVGARLPGKVGWGNIRSSRNCWSEPPGTQSR